MKKASCPFVSFVVKDFLFFPFPFCLLPFYFLLVCMQTASIIEHGGFDSFEAATAYFVISWFITRGLGCYTETIYTLLSNIGRSDVELSKSRKEALFRAVTMLHRLKSWWFSTSSCHRHSPSFWKVQSGLSVVYRPIQTSDHWSPPKSDGRARPDFGAQENPWPEMAFALA